MPHKIYTKKLNRRLKVKPKTSRKKTGDVK